MKKSLYYAQTVGFFVSFLIFFSCYTIHAQTSTTLPPNSTAALIKELTDPNENWRLGFSVLATNPEASTALKALAITLPKLWRQAFSEELTHIISSKEQEGIRKSILEQAQNKTRLLISQTLDDRDKSWLAGTLTISQDTDSALKLSTARDKLSAQSALSLDTIIIAGQKKIIVAEASADQTLFPSVVASSFANAEILADAQNLQVLVFGNLTETSGYIFLKLWAWNAYEKRIVWQYNTAIRQDEAESLVEEQISDMASIVLGSSTGGFTIKAAPAGTLISLQPKDSVTGVRREIGSARFRFLASGSYKVSLGADGFLPREEIVTIETGKTLERSYQLDPAPVRFIKVESVPSGASVYLYSRFQGVTPLEIPVPKDKTMAFLELNGYQRYQLQVASDSIGPLTVPLMKDILNWNEEIKLRRDRFYDSLGLFGLSVLPPFILNALYLNIAGAIGKTADSSGLSTDEFQKKANDANLFLYLSYGSLVLTGVAFFDMGLNLSRYLEAADFASGRHP